MAEEAVDDDLVALDVAFNMLGNHRFGPDWFAEAVQETRLGRPKASSAEDLSMGRWAQKELVRCVQNGWLPLFYFVGERPVKRINFYQNPEGPALHQLHPSPAPNKEGQIELDDGAIFPCLVNISNFAKVLDSKYGRRTKRQGSPRGFVDFDHALDVLFSEVSLRAPNGTVVSELRKQFAGKWPGKTVMHERINNARERAVNGVRSLKMPDDPPDGLR